jgi:hypothetical protein
MLRIAVIIKSNECYWIIVVAIYIPKKTTCTLIARITCMTRRYLRCKKQSVWRCWTASTLDLPETQLTYRIPCRSCWWIVRDWYWHNRSKMADSNQSLTLPKNLPRSKMFWMESKPESVFVRKFGCSHSYEVHDARWCALPPKKAEWHLTPSSWRRGSTVSVVLIKEKAWEQIQSNKIHILQFFFSPFQTNQR